ncbi:phosphate-binding domain protein [Halomicronema hongdechloris C2206]|uniref:Phosphate-binding domain protein n=1 Tax=Halomicronema hongdechloris C2206 TaxID=1641165 RepID=A0A1Z3HJJ6_9CYAN|nr:substrate-binding domain-containing protein [Halomicronema hongdechloris]ASC70455.1 phosphate-binding domain protein [Halomicronema hongdechloris C2206]
MSQGNRDQNIPALIAALLITIALAGGAYWFLGRPLLRQFSNSPAPSSTPDSTNSPTPSPAPQARDSLNSLDDLDTSLPNPAVLTIDGSVTLVALVKQFQLAYTQVNPNIPTTYGVPAGQPNGSNAGLQHLLNDEVVMAFSSRPLTAEERQAGLQAIPFARDALAVVVGQTNPFNDSLTLSQLQQIFQGQLTNWSELGGPNAPIRVINRAADSGTHSLFKDLVLLGQDFAPDGPTFTTLTQGMKPLQCCEPWKPMALATAPCSKWSINLPSRSCPSREPCPLMQKRYARAPIPLAG